jgi:hypothetical protein
VVSEFVDALPLIVLLAPDQDATVVGARRQDSAVLGMRPGDSPNRAFVAFERFC